MKSGEDIFRKMFGQIQLDSISRAIIHIKYMRYVRVCWIDAQYMYIVSVCVCVFTYCISTLEMKLTKIDK